MRNSALVAFAAIVLFVGIGFVRADSPFELSSEKIKEAIQFGLNNDCKINEFGGCDIPLNKFSLGDKIGHLDIITPFRKIASLSLRKKKSGKRLSFEEAKKKSKRPVELRVFLYVNKEDLKDPIKCFIKTNKESIDISGMVMEFSTCDDKTGKCVRSLSYLFPAMEVSKATALQIILSGEKLGEKRVEIKMNQIK